MKFEAELKLTTFNNIHVDYNPKYGKGRLEAIVFIEDLLGGRFGVQALACFGGGRESR